MIVRASATCLGVQNDGSQPSPNRPTRLSSNGAMPPSQTSSGVWIGRGRMVTSSILKRLPSCDTWSSDQSRFISGSASLNQPPRSVRSTPNAWCSAELATPSPKAGSRRPLDSRSRLASDLASTTGLRPGSTITDMPTFSLVVLATANAIPTSGSGQSPVIRSDSHRESKPSRSSPSTSSTNRS